MKPSSVERFGESERGVLFDAFECEEAEFEGFLAGDFGCAECQFAFAFGEFNSADGNRFEVLDVRFGAFEAVVFKFLKGGGDVEACQKLADFIFEELRIRGKGVQTIAWLPGMVGDGHF